MNSSVTNNGTLELGADVTIDTAADSSTIGGTLLIKDHTLTLGTGEGQTASIHSFSAIKLDNGTISFNNKQDNLQNLSVAQNKTGVISSYDMGQNGAALVLDGTTNINGTLTIQSEWNAQFDIKKLAGSGTLNIKGTNGNESSRQDAAYSIGSDGFTGTVNIKNSSATVSLADGTKLGAVNIGPGSLKVDAGNTATVASLFVNDNKAATITVNGTLNVEGLFNTWSCSNATTVTGSDAGVMKVGSMDLSNVGTNMALSHITLTVTGDATAGNSDRGKNNTRIDMSDGAKLNLLGNVSFNTDNNKFCTLNVNGGTITAGEATETQATRTFQNIVAGAQGGTVTFLNGTNSVANLDMTAGDLAVTVGANASLSVANAVLRSTITGDVTFTGTIDITNHDVTDRTDVYTGGETEGNVNGFRATTGKMKMATGTVTDTGATYMLGTTDVTQQVDKGVYTFSGETDYTTFYVNEQTEKVSTALDGHQPTAFQLAASTTLQVDESIAATVTGADATSVVTIDSDKVLTGTAQNVKIAGSGTYELTSGSTSIGANVSLDAAWTGTVRIHDAAVNNVDFKTLVNGTNSTLELMGYSGYPTAWYEKVEDGLNPQNIKLTNGSNGYAFKYTGSTVYDDHVVTFSGNWSGDGTMQTAGNHLNYKFTGDISAWNGKLQVASGIPHVTFSGKATEVNAIIDKNGQTLDLIVGEGSEFSTVFKADVDATSLTVSDNASATFKADATFGSLSGTGKVALDENSTLSVSGTVAESVKIDAADGATIDADLDTTQVGIAANATASFVQGVADVASGVSFQNEGETPAPVTVENTSADEVLHYNIGAENAKVTADSLDAYTDQAVEVKNEVVVNSIYNMGAAVTLTNVDTHALSNIENYGDQVTLQNVGSEAIEIATISLYETTVAVYTDDTNTTEGTITITEAMNAGAGTLLSNLLLANGSKLNLAVSTQEGDHIQALTLGSQFGIEDGGIVNLDDLTIAALQNLAEGDSLDLVKAGQSQLTYFGEYNGKSYDDLFVRTEGMLGDYVVYARGDAFGLTKQGAVPEPTTGTLSLLALMALAARRRRK